MACLAAVSGAAAAQASDTGDGTTLTVPVMERHNQSAEALLLGVVGELVWRQLIWQSGPASGAASANTPIIPTTTEAQALTFQAIEPVLWRSQGRAALPLALYLYPRFEPKQPPPAAAAPQQGPSAIRLVSATLVSSRAQFHDGRGPEHPQRSAPEAPSSDQRESCSEAHPQALAGWLCLAHGTGSALTAHSDLDIEDGTTHVRVSSGRPLMTRPLQRPDICGDARIAVCAVIGSLTP